MNEFTEKRERLLSYRRMRKLSSETVYVNSHLRMVLDAGSFCELFADLKTRDPLHFPGYQEKLAAERRKSGAWSGCCVGTGTIGGFPAAVGELSRNFMMGSMGSAEGEKLTRIFETAQEKKLPLILFSASGGARMQEGMFSLMQMAKTSMACRRFQESGGLYISVLCNPTTGGVSASYANLGDIILAEPGALIGFAGPRVIEQTIGEKLPEGFQRAEFQMEHGFVDQVVPMMRMRDTLVRILSLHQPRKPQPLPEEAGRQVPEEKAADAVSAYDRVMAARDVERPRIGDYIDAMFDEFTELSGDRLGAEDPAILGGIGRIGDIPVTVIGHHKGRTLEENVRSRFGMPGPQGFRKALRLMREAEKFHRPVITFVDTPGAYPGKDAEENGQSTAIAESLAQMSTLKTPVLTIVTGEGNSGGALAISAADEIWMLENAVYCVLSPEGFASILWKDSSKAAKASEVMHMTARELVQMGIADRLIPEPEGGIQADFKRGSGLLKTMILQKLQDLLRLQPEELLARRWQRWRHFEGCRAPEDHQE